MFYFAGIFLKDGFVGSLGGIYLDNSSVWCSGHSGIVKGASYYAIPGLEEWN